MKTLFLVIIIGIIIFVSCYLSPSYAVPYNIDKTPDFVIEAQNVSKTPVVTKFLIRDEVFNQVCPLGHCTIDYNPHSIVFSLPDDNYPYMYHSFQFTINYNLANLENTPNEEIFKILDNSSKFLTGDSTCFIDLHKSIVNEKQQIYYCEDDGVDTSIVRIDDNQKWQYDSIEKYDVRLDTFTLRGTYRN
ncbi:MAG TPA: hypothetical protein VJ697_09675 [Nitrososphaeraceae archaeon]|jgi:hypothetical protein|nr:hypothetical protein [Nitrososphaeraceae archaeon]